MFSRDFTSASDFVMASAAGGAGGGMVRVKAKLKRALENKDYYEAHQMYKTLYFRRVSGTTLSS